jgi:glycosyltransferase involved in cell wall biosynthesis
MARRGRLLFISHEVIPRGGGATVACWMLQALAAADYEIVVLSWGQPDFEAVDKKFGTTLAKYSFEIRRPSAFERWMIERIPDDSDMQAVNYLVRLAKRMTEEFDAVVCCSSLESDLGEPAVQYIHYPYMARKSLVLTGDGAMPWRQKIPALLAGRLRPWMIISGYSFDRMRANLHLTNSFWTRDVITRDFAMESEVVYPPAPGDYSPVDWNERENSFISIGVLEPSKRFEWIIETMAEVHRAEPSVRLHICGSRSRSGSLEYQEKLEALAREHGLWVQIHINLSNREMSQFACRQKYGIHAKFDEHFGIAPAQIARAGCIPFVHASGGQVEIVDSDPRLCYSTREEAAAKILRIFRDPAAQEELRHTVHRRSERFLPETFMSNIQTHVGSFIARRKARNQPAEAGAR